MAASVIVSMSVGLVECYGGLGILVGDVVGLMGKGYVLGNSGY